MNHTTWIEIKKSALEHNINKYRLWLPKETGIAPVIKANAYGHGLVQVGSIHDQNQYITRLCVANTQEGVQLRQGGIAKPILVLGFINTSVDEIAEYNLDMIVSDMQMIKTLDKVGQKYNKKINVHLKIDTGLSRLGIMPHEFTSYMNMIKSCNHLFLQGICSHLIQACDQESVHEQEELLKPFRLENIEIHTVNSHGSLLSKYHYSFARIGAGLYGYLPEADGIKQKELEPILSLKTRIIGLKTVPAGQTVGYGRSYTASKQTDLAVLGMGYYEGIDPDLANTGKVLIGGQFAPIVGRINMNYFTVDVTDIADVKHYDIATILGQDGENSLSAYDWRMGAKKNVRIFLAKLNDSIPRIIVA